MPLKVKIWLIVIIFSLLCLAIPLFIDHVIIGNDFPSYIPNSEWVAFLGGYIGSIIGAVTSLVGILITIRYTTKQSQRDRELQIRPYCIIRYIPKEINISTSKFIGEVIYSCSSDEDDEPCISFIHVKNIGLGPAIEINVTIDDIDDGRNHYSIFLQHTTDAFNNTVTALQPNEEAYIPIQLFFNFDPMNADDIYVVEDSSVGKYFTKDYVMQKYKSFDIGIHLSYSDMFSNCYTQTIVLSANMLVNGNDEGQMYHSCEVRLKETTLPTKNKN